MRSHQKSSEKSAFYANPYDKTTNEWKKTRIFDKILESFSEGADTMMAILFYEFAQKIGSVIKGKITNGDFVVRLFAAVLPEKKKDLVGNILDSTLRGYYNGSSGITQIAKKIYADANTASFEKFINDYGKGVRTKLSEVFSDVIPEITPENTVKNLAELFLQIIKDARQEKATKHRKELS